MSLADDFGCPRDHGRDSLSVDRARAFIDSQLIPLRTVERVALRSALRRVLGNDVIAPADVPAHDNSAMDGYALAHASLLSDRETPLRVVGAALAGRPFAGKVGIDECVRIMTGALPPPGTDTVVIQEVVRGDAEAVLVPPEQKPGQNIRRAGEDLAAGRPALVAGKLIRAAELGLIASLGIAEVGVYRRLRVAFLSTGDEQSPIGRPLGDGAVYDSSRSTIFGMLQRLGCEVLDLGLVGDRPAAPEASLREAASAADMVISSGGVSVGEADFVRELMSGLGEVLFWKTAMKPGRPMAFGRIGGEADQWAWLVGLPDNPVAVMVAFYQFVRPALWRLMGVDPLPGVALLTTICTVALKKAPGRSEFQCGVLDPVARTVRPTGRQGSGILRSMCEANCFIVLEHECGNVVPGESVKVQVFDGLI